MRHTCYDETSDRSKIIWASTPLKNSGPFFSSLLGIRQALPLRPTPSMKRTYLHRLAPCVSHPNLKKYRVISGGIVVCTAAEPITNLSEPICTRQVEL